MELLLVKVAAALVLPPGANIVLGMTGVALWRRARALATILIFISLLSLLVLSTPAVGNALYKGLESFEPRLPGAAARTIGPNARDGLGDVFVSRHLAERNAALDLLAQGFDAHAARLRL